MKRFTILVAALAFALTAFAAPVTATNGDSNYNVYDCINVKGYHYGFKLYDGNNQTGGGPAACVSPASGQPLDSNVGEKDFVWYNDIWNFDNKANSARFITDKPGTYCIMLFKDEYWYNLVTQVQWTKTGTNISTRNISIPQNNVVTAFQTIKSICP